MVVLFYLLIHRVRAESYACTLSIRVPLFHAPPCSKKRQPVPGGGSQASDICESVDSLSITFKLMR